MAFTFTPPLDRGQSWRTSPPGPGFRLMRHFARVPSGRNVWIVQGDEGLTATATQPYPLDAATVLRTFHAGHVAEEVSAEEKTALEAAGFEVVTV